jgi:hypothetical protein
MMLFGIWLSWATGKDLLVA